MSEPAIVVQELHKSVEPRDRVLTPSWLRSRFSLRATGWTVMVFEVGRTTAIICVAAFITATIIHRGIAPWARAGLNGLVIWGLGIPGYMLVVFLPAPVTLIRWQRPAESRPHYLPLLWGPTIQQAVWPAWAGVFCSMLGLPFMPSWFFVYLAALAALFSIAAYRALRAGIRSPTMLESHDCATLESV